MIGKILELKLQNEAKGKGIETQILRAKNGEEGVSLICSENPDVVVTDIMMPVKSASKIKYKKNPQNLNFSANQEIYLAYKLKDGGRLELLAIGDDKDIYILENNFLSIAEILSDKKIKKIGYDFKLLIKALWKRGINLEGLEFDAAIAAYVLNPGERDYNIEKLAIKEFGESISGDWADILAVKIDILKRLKPIL